MLKTCLNLLLYLLKQYEFYWLSITQLLLNQVSFNHAIYYYCKYLNDTFHP